MDNTTPIYIHDIRNFKVLDKETLAHFTTLSNAELIHIICVYNEVIEAVQPLFQD
jgi:hypothetical protein